MGRTPPPPAACLLGVLRNPLGKRHRGGIAPVVGRRTPFGIGGFLIFDRPFVCGRLVRRRHPLAGSPVAAAGRTKCDPGQSYDCDATILPRRRTPPGRALVQMFVAGVCHATGHSMESAWIVRSTICLSDIQQLAIVLRLGSDLERGRLELVLPQV